MTMKKLSCLGFVLAGISLTRGADAPTALENYLFQNHYGAIRTEISNQGEQTFDAKINGQIVHLMLDTGASATVLTAACAQRLKLPLKETKIHNFGVGGKINGYISLAPLSSFTIRDWPINHVSQVEVLPRAPRALSDIDGLFGYDSLRLNAAIIVVGGGGFLIRPGPPQGVPIKTYMKSRGFTAVPLKFSENRMLASGSLNGHPLTAQIDCGAAISCFQLKYLRKLDYPTTYAPVTMSGADGRTLPAEQFTTTNFVLAGFRVPSRIMMTLDSPALESEKIEAFLGVDFLADHHGVIDAGSGILWLK